MKKDTHPKYRTVLWKDSATGTCFLIGSTVTTDKTEMYEGKEYPVVEVAVSSASHPFFTGDGKFVDTEGRIDKWMNKYKRKRA